MSLRRSHRIIVFPLLVVLCGLSGPLSLCQSLTSISISPANPSITSGSAVQFQATGNYSDGSTRNLTSVATWNSSNTASLSINSLGAALGLVPGSSTVQATVGATSGSTSAVVQLSSLAGWWPFDGGAGTTALDSSGAGNSATLTNGVSWVSGQIGSAISANGTNQYASTSPIDLSSTQTITWTAWVNRTYGKGAGALIEDSTNFNTSATGFGFFPDDSSDCGSPNTMMMGLNGNVGYTLNCYAQPTSGVWHHFAAIYDKSQKGANALSLYIDGVLQPPVLQMNTSTNTNSFGNNALYAFSRAGKSNFAGGSLDDLRLYKTALTAAQIQQIYQQGLGTLSSIAVTPGNSTLGTGLTRQYSATGVFSGGATLNLTNRVNWVSTNPSAATVSSTGLVTGMNAGSTNIQAVYGAVSGTTGLSVQAGLTLVSIAVTPANFSIPPGGTAQLTATGTYSDSSTQNLTALVNWNSTNTAVATVSTSGLVTAVSAGNAGISAQLGPASGSAEATVTAISNLVGWWQFDDGAGITAADSSGNGNAGTLFNGIGWVAGQIGGAVSGNGSNQYVSISAADLSSTKAITWMGWINRTYGNGTGALIEDSSNFNASTTGFGFFPDDSQDCRSPNTMMMGVHGNVGYTLSCYTQPTSGVWHHIAAVFDKSLTGSNVIQFYLDGVLQTPVLKMNTSTNTNAFGNNPVYLFSRAGTSNFAAGSIDDLRLYKTALTAVQIQQIYQQGLGTLISIAVAPANSTLRTGATQQFIATGTLANGNTLNLTNTATWNSTNPLVASIGASGLATGVSPGSTNIQAVSGSVTGSTSLTVQAGPSLVSIAVTPSSFSLPPGATKQLTATGTYSDNSTQTLTGSAAWSSSNTAAVTVTTSGLVTTVGVGSSTVSAKFGSVSGSSQGTVTPIQNLVGWWQFDDGVGTSAIDSSGNGDTATLFGGMGWVAGESGDAVTANGTTQYVSIPAIDLSATQAVTWTAWVNRSYGSGSGSLMEATSNFNTSTTGFGFFPDDSADCGLANTMMTGVDGNVGYTLNCYAQPTSGVWHHLAAVYDKSLAGTSAISLYIDGVLQAPVRQLSTATNTNGFGNDSIYLFSRGGTSTFTAGKMDDLRLYNAALTAAQIQQIFQGGIGTLTSIAVSPANAVLGVGATQQYSAIGTFSNGNTLDLTNQVTWSSTNTAAATVNAAGIATGIASGSASIQAVYGSVSGSTVLTVQAGPTLVSVAVTPAVFSLAPGATTQMKAIGTYSDNSTQNLTGVVAWSSANTAVATVNSTGLVTAVSVGSVVITAKAGSLSGSATATVTASSNLIGWWQFDEGTGTTAADSSGNARNATLLNGVSWVAGDVGGAVAANGTTQFASIPSIDLSTTQAITWAAWVNRTYGAGTGALIEASSNFNASTTGFGFFPDDSVDCGISNTMMTGVNGNVGYTLNCYAQPTSGVWHHMAAVYDKSQAGANVISFYIDGVLQTPVRQMQTSTNTNAFGSNPIYLFSRGGASNFLSGSIDDLRIYKTALPLAQIQQIYQQEQSVLNSIVVTPTYATLAAGLTQQYTAKGNYSNGDILDLTTLSTWSSTNSAVATINASGMVTGVGTGSASIKAAYNSVSGSTALTVTAGQVIPNLAGWWQFDDGLGATAADSSGKGDTAVLFNGIGWATGQIGDGVSANGTNQYVAIPAIDLSASPAVSWTAWVNRSYGSGVGALIENTSNFNSSTTGFGFFPDDGPDCGLSNTMMTGVNGNVGYTLNCYAQPTSGVWHHLAAVYNKSLAGANAISFYIDGVLQTPLSQLRSSTNTNTFGNNPTYLFSRGGTNNFASGEIDDLRLFKSALTVAQVESIYAQGLGSLINLNVSPANTTISPGTTQQYTATGTYSNGPAQNLTNLVTWSSSIPSVATINAAGLATAVAVGSTSVQASFGTVTGSTGLTVSSSGRSLQSISVTPAVFSIPPGGTQQLTAVGSFSDGSKQDLTSSVTWISSNSLVAGVSGSGLVSGLAVGQTSIQAVSSSVVGQTTISVVPATGEYIQWTSGDSGSTVTSTTLQDKSSTTGNLILVFSHWDNQSLTATVQDQMGNVYTPIVAATNVGTNDRFQVWYAANIKGGVRLSVTVTYSGKTTSISTVDAMEYAGLSTTNPLDVFTSATGTGTIQNSGNMPTTTTASDTILGLFGYTSAATPYMSGTGYFFRNYDATTMLEDMQVASTGVYNATATSNNATGWAAFGIAFRNQLPMPPGLSVSPSKVSAGSSALGTITLNTPAPSGGATVVLTTSLPLVAAVPASVTIPAGQTFTTFPITTSAVTFTTSVSVYANYGSTATATLSVAPVVMAQLASDTFSRANATTLGTSWTPLAGAGANVPLQVVNGQVQDSVATSVGKEMYYGGLNWTPDQYSQVQILTASGGGYEGPAVRMTSNDSHYACVVYSLGTGNASVAILLDFATSYTTLASSSAATVRSGDAIRCTVEGSTLTMSNVTTSATLLTVSDGNIPSGYPGIIDVAGGVAANYAMSNWSGGASAASATPVQYASDNFIRANALNLGSNWVVGPGHGPIQIVNNQIQPYPAGGTQPSKEHFIAFGMPASDQWSQLQAVVEDTVGDLALELRASGSSDSMYVCDLNLTGGPGVAQVRIVKVLNGVITNLITDQQWSAVNPGDYIRGQVQGSLISLIDQTTGALLLSAYDTSLTSGYSGISLQAVTGNPSDHIGANWSAGTFQ